MCLGNYGFSYGGLLIESGLLFHNILSFLMSSTPQSALANPDTKAGSNEALGQGQPARAQHKNYKGFVAGVFSGIAKLSGKTIDLFVREK